MARRKYVLKKPPQPLVFQFPEGRGLCEAVTALCLCAPELNASLCFYRGACYLQIDCDLRMRPQLRRALSPMSRCLGASPVLYSFCAEHGLELYAGPVAP